MLRVLVLLLLVVLVLLVVFCYALPGVAPAAFCTGCGWGRYLLAGRGALIISIIIIIVIIITITIVIIVNSGGWST